MSSRSACLRRCSRHLFRPASSRSDITRRCHSSGVSSLGDFCFSPPLFFSADFLLARFTVSGSKVFITSSIVCRDRTCQTIVVIACAFKRLRISETDFSISLTLLPSALSEFFWFLNLLNRSKRARLAWLLRGLKHFRGLRTPAHELQSFPAVSAISYTLRWVVLPQNSRTLWTSGYCARLALFRARGFTG